MSKDFGYRKIFAVILLLLLASFLAFGTSLRNGFLIDDFHIITTNLFVKSFRFIPQVFSRPYLGIYYRPIVTISFMFEYLLWEFNPFGYHLTNIFLHFFNSVLFFILLYLIFKDRRLSTITSLFFVIHPINSITVNFISDRGNLLAGFFMLCALIAFYLGYKRGKVQLYLLGSLFFIIALLNRENAILFPLYLLCVFLILYQKGDAKQITILTTSALSISLIYLSLRLNYFNLAPLIFPGFKLFLSLESIKSFFYIIFKYFSLTIFPYNICMIRMIEPSLTSGYYGILYIFLITLCILFLLIKFRRNKIILFALGWFFVGVLPLYNLMFSRPAMGLIMQDNWIYFSTIGLFIILANFFIYLKKLINKRLWLIFISLVFLFYCDKTLANNALWKDSKTYCTYWLESVPKNHIAALSLAIYYVNKKDYTKAAYYVKRGKDNLRIDRGDKLLLNKRKLDMVFNSLGCISSAQGNLEEATKYFKMAVENDADRAAAYFNLGVVYLKKNNMDMAALHFNEAIKRDSYHLSAHYNLALIYIRTGNDEKALEEIKTALFLDPDCFKR